MSPHDDRHEAKPGDGFVPDIAGVSETMLWSLYNRASEARRADCILADPDSVHIESAMDYDFAGHFGDPQGSLAARAAEMDRALRSWIARHPEGIVVSLGEGLETQARRVDNGRMRWLSVDLPDAIRLRERFLPPTDRFRHLAISALDPAWMDAVDPSSGVFIVAQGLLMYLPPERVRQLLVTIADRFPGVELVFDAIPRWFSNLTLRGLKQTENYRLPSMPWGINRDEVEPTLRRWHPDVVSVSFLSYRSPRGLSRLVADITDRIPVVRHAVPSLVHVTIAESGHATRPAVVIGERKSAFRLEEETSQITPCRAPHLPSTIGDVSSKDGADGTAFSRLAPAKLEVFSTAGTAMLEHAAHAKRRMMSVASDEVMTTARATIEMAGCRNPAALAEAHSKFAGAWFSWMASRWMAMGTLAFEAQVAAMSPIRQSMVANAERLRVVTPTM